MLEDPEIEDRIAMEIIVDCYDDEYERQSSWYCYLEDRLAFPVRVKCVEESMLSSLKIDDEVAITGIIEADDISDDICVYITHKGDHLAVPLSHLAAIDVESSAAQAIDDWRYWVQRGYEF